MERLCNDATGITQKAWGAWFHCGPISPIHSIHQDFQCYNNIQEIINIVNKSIDLYVQNPSVVKLGKTVLKGTCILVW